MRSSDISTSPLKTAATPDSIADPIGWLLEGAGFIAVETLKIDSGMHMLGF